MNTNTNTNPIYEREMSETMKIAIGSDHAGLCLKKEILNYLNSKGYEVKDYGTYSADSCDYPDFGRLVAEAVAGKEVERGIIVCGTGIGISIAANKVPGIRAAHCTDTFSAHSCREHNDANILALGERITGTGVALEIVENFLTAEFLGGRHGNRVDKITEIEKKYSKFI
jgi:ribose 5-phosphate isomerase B